MLYEFLATYAIPSFKNICKKLLYLEKKKYRLYLFEILLWRFFCDYDDFILISISFAEEHKIQN